MSKNRCFQYKGQYYDVGTKVILKTKYEGEKLTTYSGYSPYVGYCFDGSGQIMSDVFLEKRIIEIVEPVYYQEPPPDKSKQENILFRTGSGSAEHDDDVFHGFLLYLAVMIVGVIFKDRWLIWIVATLIYFGWKKKL